MSRSERDIKLRGMQTYLEEQAQKERRSPSELLVLLYSRSQGCFHRETVIDMIRTNLKMFKNEGRTGDYIVLGIFSSSEEADDAYKILNEQRLCWGLSDLTVDDILENPSP